MHRHLARTLVGVLVVFFAVGVVAQDETTTQQASKALAKAFDAACAGKFSAFEVSKGEIVCKRRIEVLSVENGVVQCKIADLVGTDESVTEVELARNFYEDKISTAESVEFSTEKLTASITSAEGASVEKALNCSKIVLTNKNEVLTLWLSDETAYPIVKSVHQAGDAQQETIQMVESQESWTTTASGLQYRDLILGKGGQPKSGQTVNAHYTGWLTNGEKFDSSHDRGEPFSFPLGQGRVIKGWDEGIASMKVGGKRMLKIPPKLGYGERDLGIIPPNSTLLFEVELVGIEE